MPDLEVVPIAVNPRGRQRVVDYLETLLAYAKEGRINGIVVVTDEPNAVGYAKVNVTYPMALGMLSRCAHNLQKEWDDAGRDTDQAG